MFKCSPAHHRPIAAVAVEGEVVVTGPGPITGAFTPEAAERSAQALIDAAREARKQPTTEEPA